MALREKLCEKIANKLTAESLFDRMDEVEGSHDPLVERWFFDYLRSLEVLCDPNRPFGNLPVQDKALAFRRAWHWCHETLRNIHRLNHVVNMLFEVLSGEHAISTLECLTVFGGQTFRDELEEHIQSMLPFRTRWQSFSAAFIEHIVFSFKPNRKNQSWVPVIAGYLIDDDRWDLAKAWIAKHTTVIRSKNILINREIDTNDVDMILEVGAAHKVYFMVRDLRFLLDHPALVECEWMKFSRRKFAEAVIRSGYVCYADDFWSIIQREIPVQTILERAFSARTAHSPLALWMCERVSNTFPEDTICCSFRFYWPDYTVTNQPVANIASLISTFIVRGGFSRAFGEKLLEYCGEDYPLQIDAAITAGAFDFIRWCDRRGKLKPSDRKMLPVGHDSVELTRFLMGPHNEFIVFDPPMRGEEEQKRIFIESLMACLENERTRRLVKTALSSRQTTGLDQHMRLPLIDMDILKILVEHDAFPFDHMEEPYWLFNWTHFHPPEEIMAKLEVIDFYNWNTHFIGVLERWTRRSGHKKFADQLAKKFPTAR